MKHVGSKRQQNTKMSNLYLKINQVDSCKKQKKNNLKNPTAHLSDIGRQTYQPLIWPHLKLKIDRVVKTLRCILGLHGYCIQSHLWSGIT